MGTARPNINEIFIYVKLYYTRNTSENITHREINKSDYAARVICLKAASPIDGDARTYRISRA